MILTTFGPPGGRFPNECGIPPRFKPISGPTTSTNASNCSKSSHLRRSNQAHGVISSSGKANASRGPRMTKNRRGSSATGLRARQSASRIDANVRCVMAERTNRLRLRIRVGTSSSGFDCSWDGILHPFQNQNESLHRKHSLQGNTGPVRGFSIDSNPIDNPSLTEFVESPCKMRHIDSIHGRTQANHWRKKIDLLIRH